jgi:putative lipoprotein (rSAM/lipoprotein system)
MFLKFCRMLLGILGVSAVSACGEGILPAPEYGPIMAEYGVPHADYVIKGTVTDQDGNPIKGIQVSSLAGNEYHRQCDTVYTDDDGGYEIRRTIDFLGPEVDVRYEDVDGYENGGLFMTEDRKVALEKQEEGSGWYDGLFAAFGVDVKMIEDMVCEYGVPHATFEVKGKVVDADGNPIAGIEVYGEDIHEHMRAKTTTSEDGSFLLVQPEWFPAGEADICFEDVDGEENGGDFGKKTETVKLTQTEDGEGHWNVGVYSSEDLTITM